MEFDVQEIYWARCCWRIIEEGAREGGGSLQTEISMEEAGKEGLHR